MCLLVLYPIILKLPFFFVGVFLFFFIYIYIFVYIDFPVVLNRILLSSEQTECSNVLLICVYEICHQFSFLYHKTEETRRS